MRGRWYLLGYDPDRADWRTFRVDRISAPTPNTRRFHPRDLPAPDAASYVARSFGRASYRHTARVTVELPADEVRTRLFVPLPWEIDEHGPDRCAVRLSAESADLVVQYVAVLASLGADLTVEAPEEITCRARDAGHRLAR